MDSLIHLGFIFAMQDFGPLPVNDVICWGYVVWKSGLMWFGNGCGPRSPCLNFVWDFLSLFAVFFETSTQECSCFADISEVTVLTTNFIQNRKHLVHPKDKNQPSETAGCVYEISCKNCDFTYVGETGRLLGTRLKEHRKEAEKISNKLQTPISDQVASTNHIIDWGGPKSCIAKMNAIQDG